MAFQDNSYGIVLDAVLTDVGRKRMAEGKFKVTKFAVGDDEIDYRLFIADETSIDLQFTKVAATPILEAFTQKSSVINHGLLNYPRMDILYIPELKVNTSTYIEEVARPYAGRYHLAVNDETTKKLKSTMGISEYILESEEDLKTKLVVESGINQILPTSKLARERYILNLNMLDRYYLLYCDNRVIEHAMNNPPGSEFRNDSENNLYINFEPLQRNVKISLDSSIVNFDSYRIKAADNLILEAENDRFSAGSTTDDRWSALPGPRGSVVALNFKVYDELCGESNGESNIRYSILGTTGSAVFGDSNYYDYVDTNVHLEGLTTNAQINIPLRIIRYSGSA